MINKVILVGRITKDPELSFANNGDIPLVRFTLAVNRNFSNSTGVRETDFILCVAWRRQAENLAKYITKGSLLGVEGSIRVSSYNNESGQKQFSTQVSCDSVQFLESKKDNQKFNENHSFNENNFSNENNINDLKNKNNLKDASINIIEDDDELPF
ncbi:MAG: single-stranded DNA-binding protein [Vigna little leaf phytoplasma]|nr:single-stranded DNA-binding protein [Vigna little leaf phytoplasma]